MKFEVGPENVLYVHVTLVPYIKAAGEYKTKPTQHSVKELLGYGISPNIILCRSDAALDQKLKRKISLFCNVREDCVINAQDVGTIYELPLVLHAEGLDDRIVEHLNIWTGAPNLTAWKKIVACIKAPANGATRIAMIGKYVELTESYKSLTEALNHSAFANDCKVEIIYVDSEEIERDGIKATIDKASNGLGVDAVLIPGGFGSRGSEGKIEACRFARENKYPFLGICLGLQMAVIEFARNVVGVKAATSREFDEKAEHAVIDLMESQKSVSLKGGSMRLGAYPCSLRKDSLTKKVYGNKEISERHRHRFEFNNKFKAQLENSGMVVSGVWPEGDLVEIIELKDHPWFIGVQFHPEFKSTPRTPHPLFRGFVQAALKYRDERSAGGSAKKRDDGENSGAKTPKLAHAAADPRQLSIT